MKILHVITLADLGGAQSVVINLAKKSIEDGYKVIVASEEKGPMWDSLPTKVIQMKIRELQRSIKPLKELAVIKKLKEINKKYNPDVIHLHSSKIGVLGRMAFPKKKIIYTIHGFDSIRVAFRKFLPIEKALKSRAAFITSVSYYDTRNLKNVGIYKNVVTIYNGITDWSNTSHSSQNAPLKYATKILSVFKEEGKYIILTIARLSTPKRFDLFCDLASKFKDTKHIQFVWIGNQYTPVNVPFNMICLGEIKEAYRLLSFSDLFVLISDYEGMPMSIIEALSYSKPVIASNVGGISEVLNSRNGFVVKNHVEEFKNCIQFFMATSVENYSQFSVKARQTFEEKFTLDIMYKKYKDLYQNIINKSE